MRQLFVELRPLFGFDVERRFFALEIRVVVRAPIHEPAAIKFDNSCRHVAQKRPIVCYEYHCHATINEELFHPLDRVEIEMVGGLVKQEDIWLSHERPRQQCLSFLSARC